MPKVTQHTINEVHKSIMGSVHSDTLNNGVEDEKTTVEPKQPPVARQVTKPPKEKLKLTGFYLTKNQCKALKIRAATSERVEDKDQSAIVRAALDAYLSDDLSKNNKN